MTTASAKAKGRSLQQTVRNALRKIGKRRGLKDGDIESRGMGQNGLDIILSPLANDSFGRLGVECKNQESLNVTSIYLEHAAKYPKHIPILVHKRNKTPVLVTLSLEHFLLYFEEALDNILYGNAGTEQDKAA